jgi:hypothetical protein
MKIVIEMPSDTASGGDTPPSDPASPAPVENTSPDRTNGDKNAQAKLAVALNVAKNIGMQGVNAAVSNIGLATGNYYQQQKAERTIAGIQTGLGLAMAMTNPVTAVVAVAGMLISGASESYKQRREVEMANFEAEQYARRLGYTRGRK